MHIHKIVKYHDNIGLSAAYCSRQQNVI